MVTSTVAEEIAGYLPHLTEKQLVAVLHIVLAFAETNAKLSNEEEAEVLRRLHDLESGIVEGVPWEVVKANAKARLKERKMF